MIRHVQGQILITPCLGTLLARMSNLFNGQFPRVLCLTNTPSTVPPPRIRHLLFRSLLPAYRRLFQTNFAATVYPRRYLAQLRNNASLAPLMVPLLILVTSVPTPAVWVPPCNTPARQSHRTAVFAPLPMALCRYLVFGNPVFRYAVRAQKTMTLFSALAGELNIPLLLNARFTWVVVVVGLVKLLSLKNLHS